MKPDPAGGLTLVLVALAAGACCGLVSLAVWVTR